MYPSDSREGERDRCNESPFRYYDKAEEDAEKERMKPNPLVCREHGCMKDACPDCKVVELYGVLGAIKKQADLMEKQKPTGPLKTGLSCIQMFLDLALAS